MNKFLHFKKGKWTIIWDIPKRNTGLSFWDGGSTTFEKDKYFTNSSEKTNYNLYCLCGKNVRGRCKAQETRPVENGEKAGLDEVHISSSVTKNFYKAR